MALMAATSVGCSMALWNSMSSPAWLTGKYFSSKKRTLLGNTVKLWCFIASARSAVIVPFVFMVWCHDCFCVKWFLSCDASSKYQKKPVWSTNRIEKSCVGHFDSPRYRCFLLEKSLPDFVAVNLCRWCPQESCNKASNLQHFTIPISLMVFTSPDIVLYVPT